jgi:hypothetical protein
MIRNRNVFLEDFFSATGDAGVMPNLEPVQSAPPPAPTEEPPTSEPIPQLEEVSPEIDDVTNGGGTTTPSEPSYTIEQLEDLAEVLPSSQVPYPVYPPTYVTSPSSPTTVYIDEVTGEQTIIAPPVYTGGGGFGNGAMSEEDIIKGEAGDGNGVVANGDNKGKKKIMLLILLAVVLYFGYRYWKKNK